MLLGPGIPCFGQAFYLEQITHGPSVPGLSLPDRVEADANGGFVELTLTLAGNCRERYRFEWQFDQPLSEIQDGKEYGLTSRTTRLEGGCNTNRDPFMNVNGANGSSSALIGGTGLKPVINSLGMKSGWDRLYVLGHSKGVRTGSLRSSITTIGRNHLVGGYSFIRIAISAPSNLGRPQGCEYEVLYILRYANEAPVHANTGGCPEPDCAGYPGTVPVWNFKKQKGECWCPEGTYWDKMIQRCVAR